MKLEDAEMVQQLDREYDSRDALSFRPGLGQVQQRA